METAKWFTGPVIGALILGLIVGFAVGTYTSPSRVDSDSILEDGDGTATTTEVASVEGVAVSVADQPAGDTVNVSDIKLNKTSWIAVREYDNNTLGYTIGAHRLPAGDYPSDYVDVIRPTVAGKTYAVVIFYDNGDLAFDGKTDTMAAEDGVPLAVTFTAK